MSRQIAIGLGILVFACFISFGMGIKFERNRAANVLKQAQLYSLLPEDAWDLPQEAMEEIMAVGEDKPVDYTYEKSLRQESPDAKRVKEKKAEKEKAQKAKKKAKLDEAQKSQVEPKKVVMSKTPPEGAYIIQIGAFRQKEQAGKLVENLKAKGYSAYMTESEVLGKGTWYRVRIGGFNDPAKAEVVLTKLEREENIKAFMMGAQ